MKNPSRKPDIIKIIQTFGPITVTDIALKVGICRDNVNGYLRQIRDEIYISGWNQPTSERSTKLVALWSPGNKPDVWKPAIVLVKREPLVMDLQAQKFRSVFVGGVSPWAGM